jgi:hypothetical protein
MDRMGQRDWTCAILTRHRIGINAEIARLENERFLEGMRNWRIDRALLRGQDPDTVFLGRSAPTMPPQI